MAIFSEIKLMSLTGFNDLDTKDASTLYFVRTNDAKTDGFIYLNGKKYGTGEDVKAAIEAVIGEVAEGTTIAAQITELQESIGQLASGSLTDVTGSDAVTATKQDSVVSVDLAQDVKDSLGKANSAVQSVTGTGYISAADVDNAVTLTLDMQAVSGASADAQGLAEASDVKTYVDTEAAKKTVVVSAVTSADYAKVYKVLQGGTEVGTINIPKDMVVSSGVVVTLEADNDAGKDAGKYIVLTLANATNDKIYIPVSDLVDIYTANNADKPITITVDQTNNQISATINNGAVTKDMLHTDVQASLDKADSAIQSVAGSAMVTATLADGTKDVTVDLADGVKESLGKADDAIQAVTAGSTMVTANLADDTKTVTVDLATDVKTKINSAVQTVTDSDYVSASVSDTALSVDLAAGVKTKIDGAVQSVTGSDYIVAADTDNAVSLSLTMQAVEGASATVKGLAEASDVKEYVDSKLITITGDDME